MLKLNEFPQLRLIAWNRQNDETLEEKEAFALYERNWRFIDENSLEISEKNLIERLTKQFGGGILHV